MASQSPAKAISLHNKGSIEIGKDSDMILSDGYKALFENFE